jgi:D-alanyl-lipoteichoic acid acyltransferase DltB (MBOAT superfamily)
MLFNSLHFLVFFPAVVALYFAIPQRHRWKLLLAASYYFYMCWRVHYILLILASTAVDYWAGLKMGALKTQKKRKPYLYASLALNLGLLFAFKYFNFAMDSVETAFAAFNIMADVPAFDVLLPVGISFYTFQTLSYSLEVYWGKIKPEKHLGKFALYVAFFPQLVAGPIERANRLLPQFSKPHSFDYDRVRAGLIRMAWGFYKKLVIADNLAVIVDRTYPFATNRSPEELLLATYCFAFQIYCDFSGYSDIAIGGAKVLGYDLMENFRQPYYSKSIREFWQRWHISLSTWFRDYVYIPLGGSRTSKARWYANLLIVFTVSGLWHGANWTFVVWGAYHGILLALGTVFAFKFLDASAWGRALKTFVIFHLVCIGWVFFRAADISTALHIIKNILWIPVKYAVAPTVIGPIATLQQAASDWSALIFPDPRLCMTLIAILGLEAVHRLERKQSLSDFVMRLPTVPRYAFYTTLFWAIAAMGEFGASKFIYFQF